MRFLSLLCIVVLASTAAHAQSIETSIIGVTLHRGGGATVTRHVDGVSVGASSLTLRGLPENVGTLSRWQLRINGEEQPGAFGRTTTYTITPQDTAEVTELRATVARISRDIADVDAESSALDILISHLSPRGSDSDLPNIDQFTLLQDRLMALYKQRTTLKLRRTDLVADLERVNNQIYDILGDAKSYGEITVQLPRPLEAGDRVTVSHFSSDAAWRMSADAQLDSASANLNLTLHAVIAQNTGEDWPAVPLVLGAPVGGSLQPPSELDPDFWSLIDPEQMARKRRASRELASAPPAPMQESFSALEERVERRAPSIRMTSFDAVIDVPDNQMRIPSGDGRSDQKVRIPIEQKVMSVDVVARSVRGGTAGLLAGVTSNLPYGLPAMKDVRLYRDGSYLGAYSWAALPIGERVLQPFGALELLSIERNFLEGTREDKGFFSSNDARSRRWSYSVSNGYPVPITLEVLDRIPQSQDEDLRVQPLEGIAIPSLLDPETKPGVYVWRKTLAPGEAWHFEHGYRWRMPSDKMVVGDGR